MSDTGLEHLEMNNVFKCKETRRETGLMPPSTHLPTYHPSIATDSSFQEENTQLPYPKMLTR